MFIQSGELVTIIRRIKEKIKNITNSMRFTMIATYLAIIVTTLVLMSIYIISLLSENLYSTETINMFAKANIISEQLRTYGEAIHLQLRLKSFRMLLSEVLQVRYKRCCDK